MKIQLRSIFYWFTVISIPLLLLRDFILNEIFLGYFGMYFRFFGFEGYKYIPPNFSDAIDITVCHILGMLFLLISITVLIFCFLFFCAAFRMFLYPEEFKISKEE